MKMYSICDKKAGCYSPPFSAVNHVAAGRIFADLVLDDKTVVGRYPSDFSLYYVGDFDDGSGRFDDESRPIFLCEAVEFLGVRPDSALADEGPRA